MKCSELEFELALFADGCLEADADDAVRAHLETCPLCRLAASDLRGIRTDLRSLSRPTIPAALRERIASTAAAQAPAATKERIPHIRKELAEWLQLTLMPYGVGVAASVLVGVTFLGLMFSNVFVRSPETARTSGTFISLADGGETLAALENDVISPLDYARGRTRIAAESPSVNPAGALIAATRTLAEDLEDEEVVFVANIGSNGVAEVSEVVVPRSDRRAVQQIERALTSGPDFAAFVPATYDARPENVRVVLKFRTVDVRADSRKGRTRL